MARWNEEQERWTGGRGRQGEEERRGEWQGAGRDWEERGRERWMGGEHRGEESRGGSRSRGDEWRDRDRERWTTGGEYGRGMRGEEWDRDREERLGGGSYGQGRQGERGGYGYGESWRGEGGSLGEGGPSSGAGGMYGGSMGEGMTGSRRGGSGYGIGEYGGRGEWGRGGEWRGDRGGWRDTSRDFGRDLRRYGGEEQGPFERMGERMKEGFRKLTGRGPKGYKRSDERIREDVSERIARSWVNAEEVEVKVEKGEVTLTGFVDSREDKRAIEDIAEDVFGVDEVNNHLRIHREERQTFTAGQSQTSLGTQGMAGQQTGQRTQQGTQTQPGRH
jgi:hypothetical protein